MPSSRPAVEALVRAERLTTVARLAALSADFDQMVEASDASNNDDEHDPEGTTIAFERAQVSALLDQAKADLAAVDAAVERLDGDGFGTCEVCDGPIGTARLEAIPAATKCVTCAS